MENLILKMKRLIQIVLAVCLSFPLMAQEQTGDAEKRTKEREIKTSGEYLYGEAVANSKDEAVKLAKSILVSEINQEILKREDWQFAKEIKVTDVEYSLESIDLVRGSKIRAIAFVRKDGLAAIFDKNAPSINLKDKSNKKTKEKTQTDAKVEQKQVQVQDTTVKTEKERTPVATTVPVVTPQQVKDQLVQEVQAQPDVAETTQPQAPASGNAILDTILQSKHVKNAAALFEKYKRTGKLAYGKPDTNLTQGNAYLMIYDRSGNILAFLDKRQGASRKNLLTGEQVNASAFNNASQIWFQIFE